MKKIIKISCFIFVLLLALFIIWSHGWLNVPYQVKSYVWRHQECNVQAIKLDGDLSTSAQYDDKGVLQAGANSSNIEQVIIKASSDKKIQAIILDIDSNGGDPVAGDEIATALQHATKPTVALIRSNGTSAAYWAATGAGRIFASNESYVGSIGVTSSYTDNSLQNKQNGITYHSLSSGEFKDMFNTDKPLTADEQALIMQNINAEKEDFVTAVATNRHLDRNKVEALADGSGVFGKAALSDGLIDQIGGIFEIKAYLKQKTGVQPVICYNAG